MYGQLKQIILDGLALSPAHLHLVLGLVFYFCCFVVTRRPWLSLFVLLGLQIGNEALDVQEDLRAGEWSVREALVDTLWTVTLPTATAAFVAVCMNSIDAHRY